MVIEKGSHNLVDGTVVVDADLVLGSYNKIGKNVVIKNVGSDIKAKIILGDCNTINEGTKILVGSAGVLIGDWNVFHNNMLIIAEDKMEIGSNCWFGQNTILDSTGVLTIGNGVRVGMYSQIWTHVASGEQIEGCTLYAMRPTVIKDEVWLVGSCSVGSGVTIGFRSICMAGSNVTKNVEDFGVYGGVPAKKLEKLSFWKPISLDEKMILMHRWVKEFASGREDIVVELDDENTITMLSKTTNEKIAVVKKMPDNPQKGVTYFDVGLKKYTKNLSSIEIDFYRSIFGNRARFLPFL